MTAHKAFHIGKGISEHPQHLPIASLGRGLVFSRPIFLEPSRELEHVPFLFWLAEALEPERVVHLGNAGNVSYFALCQAISHLRLSATCTKVGTSATSCPDQHDQIINHNALNYSHFSILNHESVDTAFSGFDDASIDLLCVSDLRHNDSAFMDRWLAKMSARGLIVLFAPHADNRLIASRLDRFPSFEFVHSGGLKVFAAGAEANEVLSQLTSLAEQSLMAIRLLFARLGQSCRYDLESRSHGGHTGDLESGTKEAGVPIVTGRLGELLSSQTARVVAGAAGEGADPIWAAHWETKAKLDIAIRGLAAQTARLSFARREAMSLRSRLARALARSQILLDSERQRSRMLEEQVTRGEEELLLAKQELATLRGALREIESRHESVCSELEREIAQRTALANQLAAAMESRSAADYQRNQLQDVVAAKDERLSKCYEEIATLTQLVEQTRLGLPAPEEATKPAVPSQSDQRLITPWRRSSVSRRRRARKAIAEQARIIEGSGLFDPEWYVQTYPDVKGQDPVIHYLLRGEDEGRSASPTFNGKAYLEANPDVGGSKVGPLLHYIKYGQHEGRKLR